MTDLLVTAALLTGVTYWRYLLGETSGYRQLLPARLLTTYFLEGRVAEYGLYLLLHTVHRAHYMVVTIRTVYATARGLPSRRRSK